MPSVSSHVVCMFINRGNSPPYWVINPLFLYRKNRFAIICCRDMFILLDTWRNIVGWCCNTKNRMPNERNIGSKMLDQMLHQMLRSFGLHLKAWENERNIRCNIECNTHPKCCIRFPYLTTFDATFVPTLKQCNSIFNKNIKSQKIHSYKSMMDSTSSSVYFLISGLTFAADSAIFQTLNQSTKS